MGLIGAGADQLDRIVAHVGGVFIVQHGQGRAERRYRADKIMAEPGAQKRGKLGGGGCVLRAHGAKHYPILDRERVNACALQAITPHWRFLPARLP
ncbi:hypothetical protein GCM10007417_02870 [Glycocaulis alkaliphilus]|nr:hypothetical protein GCM10007417_02870 [Glycocaulis alkaliphilus]